ncbi:MAG: hypothetical protein CRU72_05570, partial [Candidatus Accumulibacter phosphatis]|nr:hypothetical protein [Candidatus Accumulibacter phosphatis]
FDLGGHHLLEPRLRLCFAGEANADQLAVRGDGALADLAALIGLDDRRVLRVKAGQRVHLLQAGFGQRFAVRGPGNHQR